MEEKDTRERTGTVLLRVGHVPSTEIKDTLQHVVRERHQQITFEVQEEPVTFVKEHKGVNKRGQSTTSENKSPVIAKMVMHLHLQ